MSKIKDWSQVNGSAVLGLGPDNLLPYLWKMAYVCTFLDTNHDVSKSDLIKDSNVFIPYSNDEDSGYVATFNDYSVISFKGTKNLKAWISDFDPYPLEEDEYKGKFLKEGEWGKGCIHDGFYDGWSWFKPVIDKLLKQEVIDASKPIYTTGHSRGGALAELCARHLAKNRGIANSVITFGSPAPGTKFYRDQFRLLPINGTRVTNGWDIVPYLPPKSFGFRHGCANHVVVGKKPFIYRLLPWTRVKDHYYVNYDKNIMKRYAA